MRNFLLNQLFLLRSHGLLNLIAYNYHLCWLSFKSKINVKLYYNLVKTSSLSKYRRSSRVYIFGSGYSLNDITRNEWDEIEKHDTLGFNTFVRQHWIRVDFHLVRGWREGANINLNPSHILELAQLINNSSFYSETILLLQNEHFAHTSRLLLAEKMLTKGSQISFYHTANYAPLPTSSISHGLRHLSGTLTDAINFAFCMGWREIVLVGVDLYDTRYFWLDPEKTISIDYNTGDMHESLTSDRGQRYDEPHSTVSSGVLSEVAQWAEFMKSYGVELSVYNPNSLLAKKIPLHNRKGLSL